MGPQSQGRRRPRKPRMMKGFLLRRRRSRRGRKSFRRTTIPMLTQILKDGCPRKRGQALSTCLVVTGSQGRTRENQRSSRALRALTWENLKPLTTVENLQPAERLQENKPARNLRLQPLVQEGSRRCRRMQTRARRREGRNNSKWSFLLAFEDHQC